MNINKNLMEKHLYIYLYIWGVINNSSQFAV